MNIDKAALEYAQKHSSAPDKETPDWVIADFKAGAKWYANEIEQLLIDLEEYFDDRADADFDYERGFIPNEEMRLLTRVQEAQKQLNANKETSY